jgi:hypothetical protein
VSSVGGITHAEAPRAKWRLQRGRFKWFKTFKSLKSIPDIFNGLNGWNLWNDWNPHVRTRRLSGKI